MMEWFATVERVTAWCTTVLALATAIQAWYQARICFRDLKATQGRLNRLEAWRSPQKPPPPPPPVDIPL